LCLMSKILLREKRLYVKYETGVSYIEEIGVLNQGFEDSIMETTIYLKTILLEGLS
jgi:hypothetical protein